MKAIKIIKVKLPAGWSNYSDENPNGPATFLRDISDAPGAFQVSLALQTGGTPAEATPEDLIELAKSTGKSMLAGDLVETSSGECLLGFYGTAIFKSKEIHRTQIWYLTDKRDFILATYICPGVPEPKEVEEVQEIINSVLITNRRFCRRY